MEEENKDSPGYKLGQLLQEALDKGKIKQEEDGHIYMKGLSGKVKLSKEKEVSYSKEDIQYILGEQYEKIIHVLEEYVDLRKEYYSLAAIWILGTYLHSSFQSYPYLFLNAMRGSGKTRMLKLISALSYKGKVLLSPTEAIMFRLPPNQTICIDELEGIMRKENAGLRELLNACYKKGSTVSRMAQKKTVDGVQQVVEEFEPYKPICIANIWGMEEVLADRCITLILEKSSREDVMRVLEDFDENLVIKSIKSALEPILVYLCSFFSVVGGYKKWNLYVKSKYKYTHTYNTYTTLNAHNTLKEEEISPELLELFNKIDEKGIIGRNLELFFPLMILAGFIGEKPFEDILEVASILNKEKRKEEMTESKDVSLIDFVSKQTVSMDYVPMRVITHRFREYVGIPEEKDDKWLNERWVGRALGRLNLILDKRRVASGIEVTLNIQKAKEKINIFK
jgi:hypothetical protein